MTCAITVKFLQKPSERSDRTANTPLPYLKLPKTEKMKCFLNTDRR
jgi:hypothetical protein